MVASPWQSHCNLSPLCRDHPCRAGTGKNHLFEEDSVHLHRCSPPLEPICSSAQLAWCRSQTSPESGFSPPEPPAHCAGEHSGSSEPWNIQYNSWVRNLCIHITLNLISFTLWTMNWNWFQDNNLNSSTNADSKPCKEKTLFCSELKFMFMFNFCCSCAIDE